MPHNISFIILSLKCMVWPGEVFRAQKARPRLDFFQTYMENIRGSYSLTAPNFIEIGPMVWISIADIQTHTH